MSLQKALFRNHAGLLVIDVQEKLFPLVERHEEILHQMKKVIKGFSILDLPVVVTAQYPQGLGKTVAGLDEVLGDTYEVLTKTTFSCLGDHDVQSAILKPPIDQWVLIGIEAHVCVLQTARDLIDAGKQVIVLNDAIGSRSIYDYSTAIGELRDMGARISSVETVLFELLKDSKEPEFKRISQIVK